MSGFKGRQVPAMGGDSRKGLGREQTSVGVYGGADGCSTGVTSKSIHDAGGNNISLKSAKL